MMLSKFLKLIGLAILPFILFSCGGNKVEKKDNKNDNKVNEAVNVPQFNADSAYLFVEKQVTFGPRVPNTVEHLNCSSYLLKKLTEFADTAFFQEFQARAFDGTILNAKNIIGSFKPKTKKRILLCAHWDSRPFADYDPNPENFNQAIDGANDGASGVGILLEIARQMKNQAPNVGIDIIFFDAEDYGEPNSDNSFSWALGAQYWARNPHIFNYTVNYGILLDMVGAKDAIFPMEYYSLQYAPHIVKKVWNKAKELGYSNTFIFKQGNPINDDHYHINEISGFPVIDIIHLDDESTNGTFFDHWHTINDNMDAIDKTTLKIVGTTLLEVLYHEK